MTAEPRETREPGAAMSPTSVCTDRGPSAVMWDMDGTLTDTEPLWLAAELELAARYDARWSQSDALAMVGRPTLETAALLHERGVTMAPEEIVAAMAGAVARAFAREPAWHAGSIELLRQVHAAGLPQALVTSSPRAVAAEVARAAGLFDAVVSADDVAHLKPDPEPYRRAAELLGVDPRHAVVLEDSPSGIAAGLAVGARVVGVQTALPVQPRPGLVVVDALSDVRLEHLTALGGRP